MFLVAMVLEQHFYQPIKFSMLSGLLVYMAAYSGPKPQTWKSKQNLTPSKAISSDYFRYKKKLNKIVWANTQFCL